jgi:hypothetical protein
MTSIGSKEVLSWKLLRWQLAMRGRKDEKPREVAYCRGELWGVSHNRPTVGFR